MTLIGNSQRKIKFGVAFVFFHSLHLFIRPNRIARSKWHWHWNVGLNRNQILLLDYVMPVWLLGYLIYLPFREKEHGLKLSIKITTWKKSTYRTLRIQFNLSHIFLIELHQKFRHIPLIDKSLYLWCVIPKKRRLFLLKKWITHFVTSFSFPFCKQQRFGLMCGILILTFIGGLIV